jgi:hypothetical protein
MCASYTDSSEFDSVLPKCEALRCQNLRLPKRQMVRSGLAVGQARRGPDGNEWGEVGTTGALAAMLVSRALRRLGRGVPQARGKRAITRSASSIVRAPMSARVHASLVARVAFSSNPFR